MVLQQELVSSMRERAAGRVDGLHALHGVAFEEKGAVVEGGGLGCQERERVIDGADGRDVVGLQVDWEAEGACPRLAGCGVHAHAHRRGQFGVEERGALDGESVQIAERRQVRLSRAGGSVVGEVEDDDGLKMLVFCGERLVRGSHTLSGSIAGIRVIVPKLTSSGGWVFIIS